MRPVDPASISEECTKRAEALGVTPEQYRRWERGEKVTEVRDAIDAEDFRSHADNPHPGK